MTIINFSIYYNIGQEQIKIIHYLVGNILIYTRKFKAKNYIFFLIKIMNNL